jgi:hypothetical protein
MWSKCSVLFLLFRGGVELRVWKAILKWRREHRTPSNSDHAGKNNRLSRNSTHTNTDKLAAFRRNSSETPDVTD